MNLSDMSPIVAVFISVGSILVAIVGCYYGLKADNARLGSKLTEAMLTERSDRLMGQATMKTELTVLITALDTMVKDIAHRVGNLETGQNEWTKALRERTHSLANDMNNLVMKVDRLERPGAHGHHG